MKLSQIKSMLRDFAPVRSWSRRRQQHSQLRRLLVEQMEARRLLSVDLPPLRDINAVPDAASSFPKFFVEVSGVLFFSATTANSGYELWKSDGTQAGTFRVKDIRPGTSSSLPQNLTNVSGTLYFWANDGTSGEELWTSNGTEAGTVRVKDI